MSPRGRVPALMLRRVFLSFLLAMMLLLLDEPRRCRCLVPPGEMILIQKPASRHAPRRRSRAAFPAMCGEGVEAHI